MDPTTEEGRVPKEATAEKKPIVSMKAESVASVKHSERNEDSFFVDEKKSTFGVFDGIGGHAAGEVASALAKETVEQSFAVALKEGLSLEDAQKVAENAIVAANQAVYDKAKTEKNNMGSTGIVGFVWKDEKTGDRKLVFASAGDSRVYLMREGKLEQLSVDDNERAWTIAKGAFGFSDDEVRSLQDKLKNIASTDELSPKEKDFYDKYGQAIDKALGQEILSPRVHTVDLRSGDRILITSDGIPDNLTHDRKGDNDSIQEIVSRNPDGTLLVKELVEKAKEKGKKPDDITALVVDVLEPEATIPPVAPEPVATPAAPEPAAAATPAEEGADEAETETTTTTTKTKSESKVKKAFKSVADSFSVKPQTGYPADMPPGLYLKWNKDHYEKTAADKRILENRSLAAEGKARLRSAKPEDWWDEHQYIKWLDGNYVPTKEDLVRDYKTDASKLSEKDRRRVDKWLKQGYKLPAEEAPAAAAEAVAETFHPAERRVELKQGFANENWDGMFGETGAVSTELDKGENFYVELTDPWIGELTEHSLEESIVHPDGTQVKIFRAEVPMLLEKDKKPGEINLSFNATAKRERRILGVKVGGFLEHGLSGQMTLVNSPDKEGVVVVGPGGVAVNPEKMLGKGMNEFLTSSLGEGLNERYVRFLKEKLGDKAKDIKFTVTEDGKLRIDFIAKFKEAEASTTTTAPEPAPAVETTAPVPETPEVPGAPVPETPEPEASEGEGEKPLSELTPDELRDKTSQAYKEYKDKKVAYKTLKSESNEEELRQSAMEYISILQETNGRMQWELDPNGDYSKVEEDYRQFNELHDSLVSTLVVVSKAEIGDEVIEEVENFRKLLGRRDAKLRQIQEALKVPEARPEAAKREVVPPSEFQGGVDVYKILSVSIPGEGGKPAETRIFTYTLKDGVLKREESDEKGVPLKYPKTLTYKDEKVPKFDVERMNRIIERETKRAIENKRTVTPITLYKEQPAPTEAKPEEIVPGQVESVVAAPTQVEDEEEKRVELPPEEYRPKRFPDGVDGYIQTKSGEDYKTYFWKGNDLFRQKSNEDGTLVEGTSESKVKTYKKNLEKRELTPVERVQREIEAERRKGNEVKEIKLYREQKVPEEGASEAEKPAEQVESTVTVSTGEISDEERLEENLRILKKAVANEGITGYATDAVQVRWVGPAYEVLSQFYPDENELIKSLISLKELATAEAEKLMKDPKRNLDSDIAFGIAVREKVLPNLPADLQGALTRVAEEEKQRQLNQQEQGGIAVRPAESRMFANLLRLIK